MRVEAKIGGKLKQAEFAPRYPLLCDHVVVRSRVDWLCCNTIPSPTRKQRGHTGRRYARGHGTRCGANCQVNTVSPQVSRHPKNRADRVDFA